MKLQSNITGIGCLVSFCLGESEYTAVWGSAAHQGLCTRHMAFPNIESGRKAFFGTSQLFIFGKLCTFCGIAGMVIHRI